ncbi:hypothetical protein [Longimicrobium sp.]|uniref:hypothetical protein n=1 Tax=Longimicrobium sp. TaxID=2029185 RepID=UPI002E3781F3|nr:hypothetical protein [Longimicrobium sp.]HEX6042395.1 hypothetical protein [Longimicrobium sp.]
MGTTLRHRSFALLFLCLSAACAQAGSGAHGASASYLSQQMGHVEVTNDGNNDFVLYMNRNGERYRLGHVARMETARFRIPPAAGGELPGYQVILVAEPVGSAQPFATHTVYWRPGQNLAGRVARNLTTQQFVVFAR